AWGAAAVAQGLRLRQFACGGEPECMATGDGNLVRVAAIRSVVEQCACREFQFRHGGRSPIYLMSSAGRRHSLRKRRKRHHTSRRWRPISATAEFGLWNARLQDLRFMRGGWAVHPELATAKL